MQWKQNALHANPRRLKELLGEGARLDERLDKTLG
jgi:hypothetical protein